MGVILVHRHHSLQISNAAHITLWFSRIKRTGKPSSKPRQKIHCPHSLSIVEAFVKNDWTFSAQQFIMLYSTLNAYPDIPRCMHWSDHQISRDSKSLFIVPISWRSISPQLCDNLSCECLHVGKLHSQGGLSYQNNRDVCHGISVVGMGVKVIIRSIVFWLKVTHPVVLTMVMPAATALIQLLRWIWLLHVAAWWDLLCCKEENRKCPKACNSWLRGASKIIFSRKCFPRIWLQCC